MNFLACAKEQWNIFNAINENLCELSCLKWHTILKTSIQMMRTQWHEQQHHQQQQQQRCIRFILLKQAVANGERKRIAA